MKGLSLVTALFLFFNFSYSQNVGIGTTTPLARLHVTDSNVVFSAPGVVLANPGNAPVSGTGRRMMWYADKAAFRAGYAAGTSWDKSNVGNYSFAGGYGSIASGEYSTALGLNNISSGQGSIALGVNAKAATDFSIALGGVSFANGPSSTAIGFQAVANGSYSSVLGYNNVSKAYGGIVLGMFNDVSDSPDPNVLASTDRIFQIGNGFYDADIDDEVRKNAITVLRNGNTGIGNNTPDPSAVLDVTSTTGGFLPPRMTAAQRIAIATPAEGLLVFQTDAKAGFYYIKNGAWTGLDDAPKYPALTICSQEWMDKNLDVTHYQNGDPIPYVPNPTEWAALTTGAWCYFWNNPAMSTPTVGKLYNWYAVNDPRGLAPAGWHIPSGNEWFTMTTCLGGAAIAGSAMKVIGDFQWGSGNGASTNSSGFSALPGGYRTQTGTFPGTMTFGNFWLSQQQNATIASAAFLTNSSQSASIGGADKKSGFSVRCIRDN